MSALPQVDQSTPNADVPVPEYRWDTHLPDETQLQRITIGVLVGIPVAAVLGGALMFYAIGGPNGMAHAALLSLPFGGMFGILGGAIGGLMATMKHH